MTSATQAPSATELELAALAEIEHVSQDQADCKREIARATHDFQVAEQHRQEAIAGQVRGERGADKRLAAATEAIRSAAGRRAAADERFDIAVKVLRSAESRLTDIRETLLDELAPSAEELTAEFVAARDALAPVLARYDQTYRAAAQRWGELEPGTRARVEEVDRERGNFDRRKSVIEREASVPESPLSAALARALLGAPCRPGVMHPEYAPDRPLSAYLALAPAEAIGAKEHPQPLAPTDPRYKRHHGDDNVAREATMPDGTPTKSGAVWP